LIAGAVIGAGYVENAQWKLINDDAGLFAPGSIFVLIATVGSILYIILMSWFGHHNDTKTSRRYTYVLLGVLAFAVVAQCAGVWLVGALSGKYVPNVITYVIGFYLALGAALVIALLIAICIAIAHGIRYLYRSSRHEYTVYEYAHRIDA
jgi:hypothetical protein